VCTAGGGAEREERECVCVCPLVLAYLDALGSSGMVETDPTGGEPEWLAGRIRVKVVSRHKREDFALESPAAATMQTVGCVLRPRWFSGRPSLFSSCPSDSRKPIGASLLYLRTSAGQRNACFLQACLSPVPGSWGIPAKCFCGS